jgi:predicted transcriptional regulator
MAKKTTTGDPAKLAPAPTEKTAVKRSKSSTAQIFGQKVMDHGYTALPNILLRGQAVLGINTTQFNIIAHLLSYWIDPLRPPYPKKVDLAKRMGITTDTLRINIAKLEERGFVKREQLISSAGDYGSNVYHLDGLVTQLQKLEPRFDKERQERIALKAAAEAPRRKRTARTGGTIGAAQ